VVEHLSQVVADSDGSHPQQTLQAAISQTSQQVYTQAQEQESRQGMGSTVACALVIGARLYTVNVGDSRIYLMRGGKILQLSTDHTWIQEALEKGIVKPEQVRGHPNAHIIRRYIGSPTPPAGDFRLHLSADESDAQAEANQGMTLQDEDRVLLCSDGLTDLVEDAEILAAYTSQSLEAASKSLVELANARGGHDNITLVAIHVPRVESTRPFRRKGDARPLVMGALGGLLAAALIIGVVLGWNEWFNRPQAVTSTPTLMVLPTRAVTPTPESTLTLTPAATPTVATATLAAGLSPVGQTPTSWPTSTVSPP
jgi:serine/threonine protein phosphatase PrpC